MRLVGVFLGVLYGWVFIEIVWPSLAGLLAMMLVGALGMRLVPAAYFGVVERFSVFAATGFNAALGLHLFFEKNETTNHTNATNQ